ncbi:hypothetical protein L596_004678 [Steinernema carpocapsae]|uniref:Uncharacterized protein n=1 Tax=Steinernema carpocapsae TaxID=34508 RepID=A0A4U8UY22_STECR|nr:hypothetical protein L596_004678 [Steinernema carpocapsae]
MVHTERVRIFDPTRDTALTTTAPETIISGTIKLEYRSNSNLLFGFKRTIQELFKKHVFEQEGAVKSLSYQGQPDRNVHRVSKTLGNRAHQKITQ